MSESVVVFVLVENQREAGMALAIGFGGRFAGIVPIICAVWIADGSPAVAQDMPWKGKPIQMYVGSAPGGGYDTFARTIAPHMSRHLPGQPTIVIQNMPGAGSLLATNHLANVAPRDGTAIAALNPQLATEPLVRPDRAKYDPRQLNWIGSALRETHVALAWHESPIKTFDDVFTQELLVAGSGGATDTFPNFLNVLLNTKFKVISGYKGTREGMLAMERGEVTGNGGTTWASLKATQTQWLQDGKVRVILQYGLSKHPELPNVPWIYDYAKSADDRAAMNLVFARQEFGRPYAAPPDVPAPIIAVLRKAFDETMKDPAFLAEAEKRRLDLDPISGEDIQKLVTDLYSASPEVIARVKVILEQSSER
jgi:tripartite-type tricarboxylate transporter receptor subunit TctC